MYENHNVSELLGKTCVSVEQLGNDEIVFTLDNGEIYKLYHSQDCCESVSIDDVVGELSDLVGKPLLMAEEVSDETNPGARDTYDESFTWTFYKFATINGYVTIKWYGTSNGYYSESVDFDKVTP